jgi:endo-1,3(4)-beta-glucanase
VLPDPSTFFATNLLAAPLPTNTFFQNFVLKNGDQPEYLHPYSIRSPGGSALDVCYPTRNHSPSFIIQTFVPDITISDAKGAAQQRHRVSAFDDLSVTLDVSPSLRAHLVRGCPYVTVVTTAGPVDVSVASVHAFIEVAPCDDAGTKWRLRMNSGQTFLLYASAPIRLTQASTTQLSAPGFAGAIRVAYLPDASMEPVLDCHSGCFPTAGDAALNRAFCVDYAWRKEGAGELLMLAHPLHLRLLSDDCAVRVLDDFRYRSIDGDLVGVVGDAWSLRADPLSPTWHSTRGVSEDGVAEVVAALRADVAGLASTPITTTSSYFYGKAVARAARLALIAEEVGCPDVIPAVQSFLRSTVTPWLDGSFQGNGFLYDAKWGGLVTQQGLKDSGADFGFGIFNDHHYHLGYFLYAIAVLAKTDPCWGRKYMAQAYSMVADFMTLSRNRPGGSFTRLRMFDLWKLHSWAGGLTEFADGRNQESTSEAVNAYYSAALVGLSYGDAHLVSVGATLTALEALAAQTWWHVRGAGDGIYYEDDFAGNNRVVGVLWANKRDSGLWFAPPEWKECRLGIQLLPLLPVSEALFPDAAFVRDLVAWTLPALARDGVGEGWKGFVYALEGVYDKEGALAKTRALTGHDDGNSLTNLLWWLHSRGSVVAGGDGRCCWYRQYCH